jgi:Protein of unknown function (DUF3224)
VVRCASDLDDEGDNAMSRTDVPRTHATGQIEVAEYQPTPFVPPGDGPALAEIHVRESFVGDITGEGTVRFLQAARPDGTASFVGLEQVVGAVGGRSGSFVLQDQGTVDDQVVAGSWFVVPGSGTGELAGLRGEGGFTAALGQNADIHLDYWFE